MNVTTSRLGIFEIVGYLFVGMLAVSCLIIPPLLVFDPEVLSKELGPLYSLKQLGVFGGVVLVALSYGLGIVVSSFAYKYYEGWQCCRISLIRRPQWHPFYQQGEDRNALWKLVDERLSRRNVIYASEPQKHQSFFEDLYFCAAYSTPLMPTVDRIASTTRFAGGMVAISWLALLWGSLLFVFSFCPVAWEMQRYGRYHTIAIMVSSIVSIVIFHRIARQYSEVYWRSVANSILLHP